MANQEAPALSHDPFADPAPTEPPNVFSDEYAESVAESYADSIDAHSIRRSESPPIAARNYPLTESSTRASPSYPSLPISHNSRRSRNSTNKPLDQGLEDPRAALRRGAGSNGSSRGPPAHPGLANLAHRSVSSASSFSYAGSQSAGPSGEGPSHPYAMYPQGLGVSRSASVATASTSRPMSQSPLGRPAHPYNLYAQNVAGDLSGEHQPQAIPVGFLGTTQEFHRRIGAEGDESDIIGPDGHTEQLPPYSRYPEEFNDKSIAGGPLPPIGESGPMSNDENTEQHADGPPTRASPLVNMELTDTTAASQTNVTEKSWREKNWRERRQTKICGLPLFFFSILVISVVVVSLICGAVIGGVLATAGHHHHQPPQSSQVFSTGAVEQQSIAPVTITTTLIDAQTLSSTPPYVSALQTGTYNMNTANPVINKSQCLWPTWQQPAWSCELAPGMMQMSVTTSGQTNFASLFPTNDSLQWGVQPPNIAMKPLQLTTDRQTGQLAFQFQMLYDKLVVLRASDLNIPLPGNGRRDVDPSGYSTDWKRQTVTPEDTPWFCYWNSTFLEMFLYTTDEAPTAGSATMTVTVPSSPGVAPSSTPYGVSSPASTGANPAQTLSSLSGAGAAESQTMAPGGMAGAGPWTTFAARSAASNTLSNPHSFRIEQRRLAGANAPTPYCVQMVSNGPNSFTPFLDQSGNARKIILNETDPATPQEFRLRKLDGAPTKRQSSQGPCACYWQQ